MASEVELLARIADLQTIATVMVFLSFLLTVAVWMLAGQVHRGCVNCSHCQLREEKERTERNEQFYLHLQALGWPQEKIDAERRRRDAKEAARKKRASRDGDGRS